MNEIKSTQEFEQVLRSANPVFVDFWAEWCGPCRVVSPIVEDLSREYGDKIDFVKVNVDENNDLAQKFNVFSIPTLAIFKNGQIVSQKVGSGTKESFKTMIDSSLN
ncbi:MAG: thioredoxin [Nitrosopumilaceae archaeon]